MMDLTPRQPQRPLIWPDIVLDLQDLLADTTDPIYVVGGAVRDAYLHRPLKDIDLITPHDALALARKIANRLRGDFFVLDAERGVGRALLQVNDAKLTIDVARFRGTGLADDLADRDFTANAMAVDLHRDVNLLIDPLGGEADLKQKQLRRCTPHSIAHDAIRTLRAVRQSVQLGLRIEPETLKDVRANAGSLLNTSPERVRDELYNLLSQPKAGAALRVVEAVGLLPFIIPHYESLVDLIRGNADLWSGKVTMIERVIDILTVWSPRRTDHTAASFGLGMIAIQLDRYRSRLIEHIETTWANERSHQALLVLAALLLGAGQIEEAAEALRLSNPERQRLLLITKHTLPSEELAPLVIHRFWRKVGAAGVDLCILNMAQYLSELGVEFEHNAWLNVIERVHILLDAYFERYEQLVEPPILLNGEQLMKALDLKPGPMIGKLLDAIREAQVVGSVHSPEEALEFARTQLS
ncbi:MAG: hypothetical protein U0694_23390 [Anaerolineae bacterium]